MPLIPFACLALSPTSISHQPPAAEKASLVVTSRVIQGLKPLAFAASPDGAKFAMTLEDNSVRVMDAASRKTLLTLSGHTQPAYAIAWSADGEYIASGDESARILLWDAHSGKLCHTYMGHIRGIAKLSFNSTRSLLMSTGNDDVVNVWSVVSGKRVGTVLGKGLNEYGACFSPSSDNMLIGLLAGGAKTYRMTPDGPKFINFLTYVNPSSQPHGVFDVNYSPDGKRCVTAGNDSQAIEWDTFTYKKIGILKGHDDFVRKAVFSPNGRLIATSSSDRTVRLWDAATLQTVTKLDNECATSSPLAFTADGKYLLSVSVDDYLQINGLSPAQSPAPIKPVKWSKPGVKRHRRRG